MIVMMKHILRALVAAIFFFITLDVASCQSVCYGSNRYFESYTAYAYRSTSYYSYYYYSCGWWTTCYSSRIRYRSTLYSYKAYQPKYSQYSYCCSGYSGQPSSGCYPLCSQGCVHGSCNSPGSCSCNNGWEGSSCNKDINECGNNNGGCQHNCTNTAGSYSCSCMSGYRSIGSYSCQDINECTEGIVVITNNTATQQSDWCQQKCNNIAGGYECDCNSGYRLQNDTRSCADINECEVANGNCEHTCINTMGSYYCSCNDGFLLLDDKRGCTDHDECANNTHDCEQECHNTHGSYRCDCFDGYRLNGTMECEDIDECEEGISGCSDYCTNDEGNFTCSCSNGYHLMYDRKTCVDSNECSFNNGGCDHTCYNLPGSYECRCEDGYFLDNDGFTCIAEPCVPLLKPFNGDIECSDGGQVTDGNCTLSCNHGYELIGSNDRICQPDHTWSGEETSCRILECPELMAPPNAFVTTPCDHEFMSSCRLICDQGYEVTNETSINWIQECVYNEDSGSVEWTAQKSCSESKVCDSSPCGLGACSPGSEVGQFYCNCEGTFHTGTRCQTGFIVVSPIETLTVGVPHNLTITGRFLNKRTIHLESSDPSNLRIEGSDKIEVPDEYQQGIVFTAGFVVNATSSGSYTLTFKIEPSTNFIQPEELTFLAVDSNSDRTGAKNENSYFKVLGLSRGVLTPSCCTKQSRLASKFCSSTVSMTSSCKWSGGRSSGFTTNGVIFASVRSFDLDLPLSVSGAYLKYSTNSFEIQSPLPISNAATECSKCAIRGTCHTEAVYSIPFDTSNLQELLKHQSIFKTFLLNIQPFLPSWLSVDIPPLVSASQQYAVYDFSSTLATFKQLQQLEGCENQEIMSESTQRLYYVLRTKTPMRIITISSNITTPAFPSPQCFVLDLCSSVEYHKLHYVIPFSLQPAELRNAVPLFDRIQSNNGSLILNRMTIFLEGKTDGLRLDNDIRFWKGDDYFSSVTVYPENELRFEDINLAKTFRMGDEVSVRVQFTGNASYQYSITDNAKIPGVLNGTMEMEMSILINNNREILHLSSSPDWSISLFVIPGIGQHYILPPGISFKLIYRKQRSSSFFSNLFEPLDSTNDHCTIDGFMGLNETLDINQLSFATNCLTLKLNQLQLPDTLSNLQFASHGDSLVIHSIKPAPNDLQSSTLGRATIGQFLELGVIADSQEDDEYLELIYDPGKAVSGSLRNVNVSVFDGEIYTERMSLSGTELLFEGDTKIFRHLDVHCSGKISTSYDIDSIAVDVDVEVLSSANGFMEGLTAALNKHLRTEIKSIRERRQNAEMLHSQAKASYNNLALKYDKVKGEFDSLSEQLNDINGTISNLAVLTETYKQEYETAYNTYSSIQSGETSLDDVCTEEDCQDICEAGVSCSTCYTTAIVEERGICQVPVVKSRTVTRTRQVLSRGWEYRWICREYWRFFLFFVIPFFTRSTQCSLVCVSYARYREEPYTVTETYTDIKSEPCVRNVIDTTVPSQCCSEYPCARKVRNFACFLRNENCQRLKEERLNNASANVGELYARYTRAQGNLTLLQVELERIEAKHRASDQEMKLVENARQSAFNNLETRERSRDRILEDTSAYSTLLNVSSMVDSDENIIEVQRIFYFVTLTISTPIVLPINIRFQYNNQTNELSLVLNLQNTRESLNRHISIEILDHVLGENTQSNRRRRRQVIESTNDNYLADTCIELENINEFLLQLVASLNDSMANYTSNMDKFNRLKAANSIQYNSTSGTNSGSTFAIELTQSLAKLQEDKTQAINTLSDLLDQGSFVSWQRGTEELHGNGSEISGIRCTSFVDCLQTALNSFESILEDTPNKGEAIREKLNTNRASILGVAINDNYTFAEAVKSLRVFEDLIREVDDVGYWCADPPVITNTPPLEVNISIGDTLDIDCIVSSDGLPVQHYWKKDSKLISSTGSKLTILDIQMSESGKYQCTAVTDAGMVSSLITTVNVYYLPIFNQTLQNTPFVETYDGYDNGVSLNCDAHSWPPPGWKWLYRATESEGWSEVPDIEANVLTFDKVLLEDEGWYTCVAYNWLGNITSTPTYIRVLPAELPSTKYWTTIEFELLSSNMDDQDIPTAIDDINLSYLNGEITKLFPSSAIVVENLEVSENDVSNNSVIFSFYISTESLEYNETFTSADLLLVMAKSLTELEKTKDNLTSMAIQYGGIQLEAERYILNSLQFDVGPRFISCPGGYRVHSTQVVCVGCNEGFKSGDPVSSEVSTGTNGGTQYMDQLLSQCVECEYDEYQPDRAQPTCIPCIDNHSTTSTASTRPEDCRALCEPHTYSEDGFPPCIACPPDYYQLEYGSTECIQCTNDSLTVEQCNTHHTSSSSLAKGITDSQTIDVSIQRSLSTSSSSSVLSSYIDDQGSITNTSASVVLNAGRGSSSNSDTALIGTFIPIGIILVVAIVLVVAVLVVLRRKQAKAAGHYSTSGLGIIVPTDGEEKQPALMDSGTEYVGLGVIQCEKNGEQHEVEHGHTVQSGGPIDSGMVDGVINETTITESLIDTHADLQGKDNDDDDNGRSTLPPSGFSNPFYDKINP